MMEITMMRGDLEIRQFQVLDSNKEPFTDQMDEVYFTVKEDPNFKEYKFQKRLTTGEIVSLGDGIYQFRIEPEDTDDLKFRSYDFDIELIIHGELKKTFPGKLILGREVTHATNEVTGT